MWIVCGAVSLCSQVVALQMLGIVRFSRSQDQQLSKMVCRVRPPARHGLVVQVL